MDGLALIWLGQVRVIGSIKHLLRMGDSLFPRSMGNNLLVTNSLTHDCKKHQQSLENLSKRWNTLDGVGNEPLL